MIWHRSGVNSEARTVRTSSPQLFQFPFLLQQIDVRGFFSAFCIQFTALSKWWLFVLITYKCCFFPLAATVNCCHILCFFSSFFFEITSWKWHFYMDAATMSTYHRNVICIQLSSPITACISIATFSLSHFNLYNAKKSQ